MATFQHATNRILKSVLITLLDSIGYFALLTSRKHALLLSELGGHILRPAQAPAGTKRLSNLLRSKRWSYTLIEVFLWPRANERIQGLKTAREEALVV